MKAYLGGFVGSKPGRVKSPLSPLTRNSSAHFARRSGWACCHDFDLPSTTFFSKALPVRVFGVDLITKYNKVTALLVMAINVLLIVQFVDGFPPWCIGLLCLYGVFYFFCCAMMVADDLKRGAVSARGNVTLVEKERRHLRRACVACVACGAGVRICQRPTSSCSAEIRAARGSIICFGALVIVRARAAYRSSASMIAWRSPSKEIDALLVVLAYHGRRQR